MGIGTSHHQVLRAQYVAPRCRPSALLNTDKGRLCQIGLVQLPSRWSATIFCFCFAARNSHCFRFFNISIQNSMAGHLSTSPHSYDIQRPIVAHHSPSKAPELVARWFPHIAAATSLSPRSDLRRKKLGTYMRLASVAVYGGRGWNRMGCGQWTF